MIFSGRWDTFVLVRSDPEFRQGSKQQNTHCILLLLFIINEKRGNFKAKGIVRNTRNLYLLVVNPMDKMFEVFQTIISVKHLIPNLSKVAGTL